MLGYSKMIEISFLILKVDCQMRCQRNIFVRMLKGSLNNVENVYFALDRTFLIFSVFDLC